MKKNPLYEEKMIDDVLHFRNVPDAKWLPVSNPLPEAKIKSVTITKVKTTAEPQTQDVRDNSVLYY